MNVKLIAHTKLSDEFNTCESDWDKITVTERFDIKDSQAVALTAIRTCYSHSRPSEIVEEEGPKYFGRAARDGEGGTEYDRLVRHILRSKHTSTMEHLSYTIAIEGLSRAALAQLTRHRVGFSFSVQSQRYVKFGSCDKSRGFDAVTPPSILEDSRRTILFDNVLDKIQETYDELREMGVPAEDARMILPNTATCNLVMTANLRALLDFYSKRKKGRGAQWEIAYLAENIKEEIIKVDPWTAKFFEEV